VAFPNPFHRRGDSAVVDRDQADRDRDGVDDRNERGDRYDSDRDRNGVADRVEPTRDGSFTTRLRARMIDRDRDGVDDRAQPPVAPTVSAPPTTAPTTEPATEPPAAPAPVVRTQRTSMLATFGLIIGTAATFASLTGRLAPLGIAVGIVGLIVGLGGVLASARRRVNGRGVAYLAVLASLAGIVFGILALNGAATWLDADVNQVDRLRDWLDTQVTDITDR
jgi:hypothetical protein